MHRARAARKTVLLALIDGQMPEMDGFTLAERIQQRREAGRQHDHHVDLPVSHGRATRTCRELAAYLTKPVKQSDLLDTIVSALGTGRSEEVTSRPDAAVHRAKVGRRSNPIGRG